MDKLHEERGEALRKKLDEIDKLLKPYTKVNNDGTEVFLLPNEELVEKYLKLDKEYQEIVEEIRIMHQN